MMVRGLRLSMIGHSWDIEGDVNGTVNETMGQILLEEAIVRLTLHRSALIKHWMGMFFAH